MVQNQTIEGFEDFLENHRKELQEKNLREPEPERQNGYDAEEIMLEQLDVDVSKIHCIELLGGGGEGRILCMYVDVPAGFWNPYHLCSCFS